MQKTESHKLNQLLVAAADAQTEDEICLRMYSALNRFTATKKEDARNELLSVCSMMLVKNLLQKHSFIEIMGMLEQQEIFHHQAKQAKHN